MKVEKFIHTLEELSGGAFYTGVPDSLLGPFIDAIVEKHGISDNHIVAANEGSAVGLAAGRYLATGRPAVVYMQNSGIGNAVNPICSLLHEKVYALPFIFVIGWRGEPGNADEPQHIFQGEATLSLLDCLKIPYTIVSKENDELLNIAEFKDHLNNGRSVAFIIRKGALLNSKIMKYTSSAILSREESLKIALADKDAVFVCTTGKLSREVFEIREQNKESHSHDFLTVGSMGHSLMIAYGIAQSKPAKRVYCLDGDGAMLMHMGSLAVVGAHGPPNLIHIVINNGAHETVGGLPAASGRLKLHEIARACGYQKTFCVASKEELSDVLAKVMETSGQVLTPRQSFASQNFATPLGKGVTPPSQANNLVGGVILGPVFIEVMCNLDSRADLIRPTTTPIQNKNDLMEGLKQWN